MLNSKCPWCNEKISQDMLGKRRPKNKAKWYRLTRYINVCPYCNKPVKISRKIIFPLMLMLPLVLSFLINSYFQPLPLTDYTVKMLYWVLAITGGLILSFTENYEKADYL